MARGRLISFEGGEGAGKSTVIAAVAAHLDRQGMEVVVTREPGGTVVGEAIRGLLLDPAHTALVAESELLLMFASRAQLVRGSILPALQRGVWVLTDRFTDASFAYQGGGRGLSAGIIADLERWAAGIKPDLTVLLDVPIEIGLGRARERGGSDRIESESQAFFQRVRAAYRARAALEPERIRTIDASQSQERVAADVLAQVDRLLAESAQ